ncbi:MAG: FAD-dependent thymidylate synthase [Actinomycetota bacterium]|nr:FAD-dependent thymidylate synthase [Actinomycetota bacterium]
MSFPTNPTPSPVPSGYHVESFTQEERILLSRFFTNVDGPVFGIVNLPEVVKGALFARYSRSPNSVRRLFLDEFVSQPELGVHAIAGTLDETDPAVGLAKARGLYDRVFTQFGDDSVAQLGGAHIACEQASNVLTKVLEWGRLASYLEQSTRYIFYDRKLGGRYRYHVPEELIGSALETDFRSTMDGLFDSYSSLIGRAVPYYETLFPKQDTDSMGVWRSTIRAKACDDLRGMLPAATTSNVGIFGSGQAYEMLLMRMRAHPLAEIRNYSDLMLTELRSMIPSFLTRVDVPDRGGAWSDYLASVAADLEERADALDLTPEDRPQVKLVEWDPDGETKVAAAALYAVSDLPDDQLLAHVRSLPAEDRADLITAAVGTRGNRRHKPGRAMERTSYRFDVLSDYGIFRDLQRHRMLTIEWQRLSTDHGYITPDALADFGATTAWDEAMERTAQLATRIAAAHGPTVAQYAVPFAYRVRYYIQMNAREAFHLLELRSQASGHPGYRKVAQEMHRLIRDKAGHRIIADAMQYVDHNDYDLARLEEERRLAARRAALGLKP